MTWGLLVTLAMLVTGAAADDEGGCAPTQATAYLSVRQELAPLVTLSQQELDEAISSSPTGAFEMCGALAGMASCATSSDSEAPMNITVELEQGGGVALRAPGDISELRVGEPICVIARVASESTNSRDLSVVAWVRTWDLPEELRPHNDEAEDQPEANAEPEPAADEGAPGPQAVSAYRLDSVEVWQGWALKHNSKLSHEQARRIASWVLKYSQQHNVNHKLIFAVIRWESDFNPGCVSHAGAIGLMQLMPGTARWLGVDPWNVEQNIEGGVHYLSEQLATYADRPNYERVILALACYNAGPNAVKRAGGVPNITETQRYVRKVSTTFRELHEAGFP